MKTLKTIVVRSMLIGLLFGCSDVGFRSLPSDTCTNFNNTTGQTCQQGAGKNQYTVTFHTGDVDILIVNDNSSSMSPEQARMASSFPSFMNSINSLYYQIGMITTDVKSAKNAVSKAANGFGAFQDGKLLEFTDEAGNRSGEYILKKDTANRDSKFRGTIKRRESIECDSPTNGSAPYAEANCPSGDERGVYALNLAANRNEHGFFRAGAHLAVIVLSDEDERSRYTQGNGTAPTEQPGYALEDLDRPATFVSNMAAKYPSKSISVHSVIVAPGDYACFSAQNRPVSSGFATRGGEGFVYAELARPSLYNSALLSEGNLVEGVIGSICASDYGAQLGNIAAHISANARQNVIQMPCTPDPNDISVSPAVNYTIDADDRLIFSNLPVGVEVNVTYLCPAHI